MKLSQPSYLKRRKCQYGVLQEGLRSVIDRSKGQFSTGLVSHSFSHTVKVATGLLKD